MSSFTKPLVLKKLKNGLWEVYLGFKYYVGEVGGSDQVYVPSGFKTDLASVPRAFWIILPPDGTYAQSAVLHDYLYHKQIRTRKESDRIFLESMKVLGVPWWKRKTMYRAVRSFGWIPWKNRLPKTKKKGDEK
jgi:hypothetical protein